MAHIDWNRFEVAVLSIFLTLLLVLFFFLVKLLKDKRREYVELSKKFVKVPGEWWKRETLQTLGVAVIVIPVFVWFCVERLTTLLFS